MFSSLIRYFYSVISAQTHLSEAAQSRVTSSKDENFLVYSQALTTTQFVVAFFAH